MGTGKTTAMIDYINSNPNRQYIFITPFLKECERIDNQTNVKFVSPDGKYSKTSDFRNLISEGDNIIATHKLFSFIDSETMELLKMQDYVLILDEVLEVVEPVNIKKDDIDLLLNNKTIKVLENEKINWIDKTYVGNFNTFKNMCINQTVIFYKGKMMLRLFPCEVFDCFSDTYILTYLFEGSRLKSYLDIYNKEYLYYKLQDNQIVEGKYDDAEFKQHVNQLVNLYNGKLNDIGSKYTALSAMWYKDKHKSAEHKILKNNIYNYFRNVINDISENIMYSVFSAYEDRYKGTGYCKCFIPMNCRATNDYANKRTLCYAINVFENPMIKNWFEEQGVELNEEIFALSTMIQWIWRSAIRNDQKIEVFIPSNRMREIFVRWIKNDFSRINLLNVA